MWHFFKERGLYQWMSVTSFFQIVMMSYDSLASWLYVDLHLLTSEPRTHKLTKVHITIKFNTNLSKFVMPLSKLNVFIHQYRSKSQPCSDIVKISTSCGARILSLQTFLYKKCAYTHIRIQNHHIKESKQHEQYIYKVHFFPNDLNH